MGQDNNRLRLNFPFEGQQYDGQQEENQPPRKQPYDNSMQKQPHYENQHFYEANNSRVFPTTPSTFPQPIYPNQQQQPQQTQQQQEHLGSQYPPNQQGGGYFMNNPYPPQQQQPNQYHNQGQYQYPNNHVQSPPAAYQGNRQFNDATNGMIQQFSNQALGSARGGFNRTPSPSNPRPRTAGDGGRAPFASHLAPPMPSRSPKAEEEEKPNPGKYSENVLKRGSAAKHTVANFFQVNIERARDRNTRAKELAKAFSDDRLSDAQKQQMANELAQKEARFLRFIRTREAPDNFSTLKVIGKGAFGEVKLVQRKTDGKIYALKSLIKTEMFKKDQLAHVRAERDILADSKDNPWLVKLHASFQDDAFLYMLMEFLPGGDLMTMLIKYEIFSEDITRFYMAEIIMAIEAVHQLGFLHRYVNASF